MMALNLLSRLLILRNIGNQIRLRTYTAEYLNNYIGIEDAKEEKIFF